MPTCVIFKTQRNNEAANHNNNLNNYSRTLKIDPIYTHIVQIKNEMLIFSFTTQYAHHQKTTYM